jgi:hypothetical protein
MQLIDPLEKLLYETQSSLKYNETKKMRTLEAKTKDIA